MSIKYCSIYTSLSSSNCHFISERTNNKHYHYLQLQLIMYRYQKFLKPSENSYRCSDNTSSLTSQLASALGQAR